MTGSVLDDTFMALSDPTRRAILARLRQGEAGVMELAAPFALSQPAITKHLKVLERAGLITRGRDAQRRPCRLAPDALKTAHEFLDTYKPLWAAKFDRLDHVLEAMKANHSQEEGST